MTQEQLQLFAETFEKVNVGASTIFSKEDVVRLLSNLQQSITELPNPKVEPINGYDTDTILKAVKDMLENYDFDQYLDYDPELNGAYGGSYTLEINASFNETQFTRDLLCELPDYFETNNEE
jgi:hypothetical protein